MTTSPGGPPTTGPPGLSTSGPGWRSCDVCRRPCSKAARECRQCSHFRWVAACLDCGSRRRALGGATCARCGGKKTQTLDPRWRLRAARQKREEQARVNRQSLEESALEVRARRQAAREKAAEKQKERRKAQVAKRHPLFYGSAGASLKQLLRDLVDMVRVEDSEGWIRQVAWLPLSGSATEKAAHRRWERIKARMRDVGIDYEVFSLKGLKNPDRVRAVRLTEEGRDRYEGLLAEFEKFSAKREK